MTKHHQLFFLSLLLVRSTSKFHYVSNVKFNYEKLETNSLGMHYKETNTCCSIGSCLLLDSELRQHKICSYSQTNRFPTVKNEMNTIVVSMTVNNYRTILDDLKHKHFQFRFMNIQERYHFMFHWWSRLYVSGHIPESRNEQLFIFPNLLIRTRSTTTEGKLLAKRNRIFDRIIVKSQY